MNELTAMAKADSKNLIRTHVKRWGLFLLLPVLLPYGCGGGGGDETNQPTGTPQATTSTAATT